MQDYIGRLKVSNPAAAQTVAATFGAGKYDYGQVYWGIIDGTSLRDNAADALATYLYDTRLNDSPQRAGWQSHYGADGAGRADPDSPVIG